MLDGLKLEGNLNLVRPHRPAFDAVQSRFPHCTPAWALVARSTMVSMFHGHDPIALLLF